MGLKNTFVVAWLIITIVEKEKTKFGSFSSPYFLLKLKLELE